MNTDNLSLFIYTLDEYKRFYNQIYTHSLTDEYDEASYRDIHIKLMLLRKYGTKKENVYLGKLIENAMQEYPEKTSEWKYLLENYISVEEQQLEHILPDGTTLNLYESIEDVMYGMYLHADKNRIIRLSQTDESLRFICVRKYVEDFEKIIFKVYDCLKECEGVRLEEKVKERASVIYFGDHSENVHGIEKSPYWKNLYGNDGSDEDLKMIIGQCGKEEIEIQIKCLTFLDELKKDNISLSFMDSIVFPTTKKDWGDYSEARSFFNSIKNPGISSKIRYNEEHTMAYVRIFPQVEDVFIIRSPHICNEIYEICLVKNSEKADWKIYSMGGHLESYLSQN